MSRSYIKTKIINVNNLCVPKRFVKPILKCPIRPHPCHLGCPAHPRDRHCLKCLCFHAVPVPPSCAVPRAPPPPQKSPNDPALLGPFQCITHFFSKFLWTTQFGEHSAPLRAEAQGWNRGLDTSCSVCHQPDSRETPTSTLLKWSRIITANPQLFLIIKQDTYV